MVLAYHVIFSTYGFWLPNDERGSGSVYVRSENIRKFGPATFTDSRRSVAGKAFNRSKRDSARAALRYPSVHLTGRQAAIVGRAFADGVERSGFHIYACAILPQHVHLAIGRHSYAIEQVVRRLKANATRELSRFDLHPMQNSRVENNPLPSPWGMGFWKVFLNSTADIMRTITYVEQNPMKHGKPPQHWKFVTRFGAG